MLYTKAKIEIVTNRNKLLRSTAKCWSLSKQIFSNTHSHSHTHTIGRFTWKYFTSVSDYSIVIALSRFYSFVLLAHTLTLTQTFCMLVHHQTIFRENFAWWRNEIILMAMNSEFFCYCLPILLKFIRLHCGRAYCVW